MHERLLRIREVLQRTGYSRSAIYKLVAEGGFPKQIKIGPRAAAWPESAIDQWIAEKICPVVLPKAKGKRHGIG